MSELPDAIGYYRQSRSDFELALTRAGHAAMGTTRLKTEHRREVYTAILVTKLAVSGKSLLALCPDPAHEAFENQHMDYSAAAALTRVLLDTFVSLFHFGIENCSEEESQLRELLMFWRDFKMRIKIGLGGVEIYGAEEADFHERDLRRRMEANSVFMSLDPKRRKDLLKKRDLLYPPEDIAARAGFEKSNYQVLYSYWSAYAHCDTVAFIKTGENLRGVGRHNDADTSLIGLCLDYAAKVMNRAADGVDEVFPGAERRARELPHFDFLNNRIPMPPWAGRTAKSVAAEEALRS